MRGNDNPFGFAGDGPLVHSVGGRAVAVPAKEDEAVSAEQSRLRQAAGWESIARGLGNVWMGTNLLVGGLLIFALVYVVSEVTRGFVLKGIQAGGGEVGDLADSTSSAVRLIIYGGGALFLLMTLAGSVCRIYGLLRCMAGPGAARGRLLASGAALFDILALVALVILIAGLAVDGLHDGLRRLLLLTLTILGRIRPGSDFPWIPLGMAAGAGLTGLACLLLFVRRVGLALLVKQLTLRVRSFAVWCAVALVLSGTAYGAREWVMNMYEDKLIAEGYRAANSTLARVASFIYYGAMGIHVTMLIVLLLKYLGLLSFTTDELRKRTGRYWV
ncbi:hypothetical protein AYO44_13845 [Planctomycetaceae bacterium SCGC AG-212-F19]|nr:hypothetical protein AYO44_13845 [Planctomycetaceae bacterium SCGC AG-212-F19]